MLAKGSAEAQGRGSVLLSRSLHVVRDDKKQSCHCGHALSLTKGLAKPPHIAGQAISGMHSAGQAGSGFCYVHTAGTINFSTRPSPRSGHACDDKRFPAIARDSIGIYFSSTAFMVLVNFGVTRRTIYMPEATGRNDNMTIWLESMIWDYLVLAPG